MLLKFNFRWFIFRISGMAIGKSYKNNSLCVGSPYENGYVCLCGDNYVEDKLTKNVSVAYY